MNYLKQLAGQTAVYGVGIVVPRLLNYIILTPFYTRIFSPSEYGIITELYAYVVFLIVILTYGMETGFFRYADKEAENDDVYKTSLVSLAFTSLLFIAAVFLLIEPVSRVLQYQDNKEYIQLLAVIVALDAFTAIPFARIRLKNKALKYSMIRLAEVSVNVGANIFFLVYCRDYYNEKEWIERIYHPDIKVVYVLISNLLATGVKTLLLSGEIFLALGRFSRSILNTLLKYSAPLLIAGLAGTVNEAIDRILLRRLIPAGDNPLEQLGIYGANYKLAVLMTLFIQMFRFAAEPFFFSKKEEKNAKRVYADVMKYFFISAMLIFLGVTLFIDIFVYFIGPDFRSGMHVVPVILMANLFMGIFFNLSIWYKLQNLTLYGAGIVSTGAVVTFLINYFFIPKYGYVASAWSHFISYGIMVLLSYFLGKRHFPVNYDVRRILLYGIAGTALYYLDRFASIDSVILSYLAKSGMILGYLLFIYGLEKRRNTKRNAI